MKGCARAAIRDYELLLSQAWHATNFANAGSKLKDLSEYLPRKDDAPIKSDQSTAISPAAVLDKVLTLQAAGVPMKVRKVR